MQKYFDIVGNHLFPWSFNVYTKACEHIMKINKIKQQLILSKDEQNQYIKYMIQL